MTQNDHSRIRVGDSQVGVTGLKGAIEEIAQARGDKTDFEVARALLESLGKQNYIPASSRDDYAKALLQEFEKALGQPCQETVKESVSTVVLSPGCSQCNRLEQIVMQALTEFELPAAVEHVTDIKGMANYGLVRTPALVINDKVVVMGTVPSPRKIEEMLAEAHRSGAG